MDKDRKIYDVCIGLGANLGDRLNSFKAARAALAPYIEDMKCSPVYEAKPTHVIDQPSFYNAVLVGKTNFDPRGMLYTIKDVEIDLGRKPTFHHGPRLIDLDMMFHGDSVLETAELTLPHPHMVERIFCLLPMADLVPDWRHPVLGKTVTEMLSALADQEEIKQVADSF